MNRDACPIRVEGERLRLRELADRDLDGIFRIYGDPVATRTLSFEPKGRDEIARFLNKAAERAMEQPRIEYALAAALKETDEAIGSARLALGEHRSAQIGFALAADHWGQGLGTELASLLLDLGFARLGLHRIWGARAPDNAASERLMLKLGMMQEGKIRHHVFVRGAWRDSVVHSILENEWTEFADCVRAQAGDREPASARLLRMASTERDLLSE